jgi:hypothetical protein
LYMIPKPEKCTKLTQNVPNGSPIRSPPGVNTLYCLEEWRGKQRISPPGENVTPRGQNSPLGNNFAPGGKSLPLGPKLRMWPWRHGIVVIAFAYRTEDPRFESRQGVRFLGIYTLQCCFHNLICIVIVCTWEK